MDRPDEGDEETPERRFGQFERGEKEEDGCQGMPKDVDGMVPGGVETEEADIELMGGISEGAPKIRLAGGKEGPLQVCKGQPRIYIWVFGDIQRVIVIDEVEFHRRGKGRNYDDDEHQRQAPQEDCGAAGFRS